MKKPINLIFSLLLAFFAGYFFHSVLTPNNSNEKIIKSETKIDDNYRVSGIAGIFFKSHNPGKLNKWYQDNLGLKNGPFGARYEWQELHGDSTRMGSLQWSAMSDKGNYFLPSSKDFMINYRVENLERLVADLKKDSIPLLDSVAIYPYGKFIHLLDIEGNKIELYEPNYEFKLPK
ncbi:MAG: VOC family protein [Flavobacteriales bacterium]